MPTDTGHFSALVQALLLLILAVGAGLGLGSFGDGPALFSPVLQTQEATLRIISVEEAAELHAQGAAVFIDTRDSLDYLDSHLPGAGNLPLKTATMEDQAVTVVIYCSDPSCGKAATMGRIMLENGIKVAVMPEGAAGWADSGGLLEMSQ